MTKKHNWLVYALFPATLTYVVWALSMIPCAIVALANIKFKLDTKPRAVILSMGVGLLGAGGQLILFEALKHGPAYLIFPLISVAPIVTVILSTFILKERVSKLGAIGIFLAFVALVCFSLSSGTDETAKDNLWIILASLVFICWGTQAFVMKLANNHTPDAESVFVYMAISAVMLIPVALLMTDFSQPVNMSFNGPYLTFGIQILNSIGAFALVYANRYGKAMIVAPLADALAPVITTAISLVLYAHVPGIAQICGIVSAISCVLIFSREQ